MAGPGSVAFRATGGRRAAALQHLVWAVGVRREGGEEQGSVVIQKHKVAGAVPEKGMFLEGGWGGLRAFGMIEDVAATCRAGLWSAPPGKQACVCSEVCTGCAAQSPELWPKGGGGAAIQHFPTCGEVAHVAAAG